MRPLFCAQKSLNFQGPSNAPRNDVALLKTITYRVIKTTGTLKVSLEPSFIKENLTSFWFGK
jgi:hypothetical protein